MPESIEQQFQYFIPIVKSVQQEDGSLIHHGIASDESLDLQGERVPQDFLEKSIPYLRQWGKFNWDHGEEDVGDVSQVQRVTPSQAKKLTDLDIVGAGLYVKGNVYPIVDPAIASEDLKRAHHRLLSKARLGYSLHGVAVRNNGRMTGAFANRVSICPQPINLGSVCMLYKSMGQMFTEFAGLDDEAFAALGKSLEAAEDGEHAEPQRVILVCPDLNFAQEGDNDMAGLEKGLGDLSSEKVQRLIREALNDKYPQKKPATAGEVSREDWWVKELFEDHAIVQHDDKDYEVRFAVDGTKVQLTSKPVEVVQEWIPAKTTSQVEVSKSLLNTLVCKALEAGGGVSGAFTGGRALQRESLDSRIHTPLLGGTSRRKRKYKGFSKSVVDGLMALIEKALPALGSGERFKRLKAKIARRGDVRDPATVAAAAGRKKHGAKKMAELAAAGRRRAAKKRKRS